MSNVKSHTLVRRLVESAILIAIGTVLSELKIDMPLGGGLTVCSMLPLVLIAHRWGNRWGLFTAFVYSLLQLLLGMNNVQYATSALMVAGIVLLDYVVPYTLIGLSAVFNKGGKPGRSSLVCGIIFTFVLRFVCHFITGWWIWDALWPNEFGWASPIYSILYNGAYMLPEIIITVAVALLLFASPVKKYILGEDIH